MPETNPCSCGANAMADSLVDPGNLAVAMTVMANAAAAGAARRTDAADQLSINAQYMWTNAMASPTINAAMGYRTATESGSGRTRAETNNPGNTAAPGGGT